MTTTSKAIKQGQYNPMAGTRKGNRWTFQSESRERVIYTAERDGREYRCGCPATGLCKHITSAVIEDAKAKFSIVQVWTDRADAVRQHRRTVEFTANGQSFWVTFAERGPLTGVVRFCPTWGNAPTVDLWYRNADGSDRCETVGLDYGKLVQMARDQGWTQSGCYWCRP